MAIDSGAVGILAIAGGGLMGAASLTFWLGGMSSRLRAVEAAVKPIAGLGEKIIALETSMRHLIGLLEDEPSPPRRARAGRAPDHG